MKTTIYHNPRCSKSRAVMAILRDAGIEPEIVEYLKTPLNKPALQALIKATGLSVRECLRSGEDDYKRLGLSDQTLNESMLLDIIAANPILLNRPIVVTEMGTRLCRPPELVKEIIPN